MLQHTFVSFSRAGSTYTLTVYDLNQSNKDGCVRKKFTYESDVVAETSDLVIIGDAVYVAPHNKVLYLVNGVWYLRDFVSTTPIINAVPVGNGEPAVGYIRFVEPITPTTPTYSGTTTINIDGTVVVVTSEFGVDFDTYLALIKQGIVVNVSDYVVTEEVLTIPQERNVIFILTRRVGGEHRGPIEFTSVPVGVGYENDLSNLGGSVFNLSLLTQNLAVLFPEQQTLFITTSSITGGTDSTAGANGTLNANETYYYTVRYRYQDGHVTQVCYPVSNKTGNQSRYTVLDIQLTEDIDGSFADVEIFRKTATTEFELIERLRSPQPNVGLTTLRYYDIGKLTSNPLTNRVSIWTQSHQTHAVVRDRYVRGNVTYPDLTPQVNAVVTPKNQPVAVDDPGLPFNAIYQVYTKVRFDNGLESYFVPLPNGAVTTEGVYSYVAGFTGKELAFYAQYRNQPDEETISFASNEIYNLNVPSLATIEDTEAEQDRPVNPHVFFGYRYVSAKKEGSNWIFYTLDKARLDNASEITIRPSGLDITQSITDLPERIYIQLGRLFPLYSTTPRINFAPYTLKFVKNKTNLNANTLVVYELEYITALKEVVFRGDLQVVSQTNNPVSVTSGRRGTGTISIDPPQYSKTLPNERFYEVVVDVVGIEDKSSLNQTTADQNAIYQPESSNIYLVLDPESVYKSFDFVDTELESGRRVFPFALLNVKEKLFNSTITNNVVFFPNINKTEQSDSVFEYRYSSGLVKTKNVDPSLPPVYLGRTTGNLRPALRSGYIKRLVNGYEFYELDPTNIYETLVTESDLGTIQTSFPNQIVWSDSFSEGTNVSGVRNFRPESFLNISTEYGPIVKLEYHRNNVVIFCRNGIAVVSVGEVLTQGSQNQVVVDTSRFLNSEVWVHKATTEIDPESIVQFEGQIFFADQNDVWVYGDGIRNISNGAVPIKGGVGSVEPITREYRLTSQGLTWAYNFEINEWTGPYTYQTECGLYVNGRFIESVQGVIAEDLGDASTDKLYRKFYIQHEGDAEFTYTKDDDYFGRELSEYRETGDTKQIGIKNLGAAKRIYWRLRTMKDFVLNLIAFEYTPRNRR
jgi:hypothetical protein